MFCFAVALHVTTFEKAKDSEKICTECKFDVRRINAYVICTTILFK